MKRYIRTLLASLVLTGLLGASGCQQPTSTVNTTPANTGANTGATTSASPTASPAVVNTSGQVNLPVTLPVLDAMFADESFAGELKSRLQLTDEQVQKLRTIAREETASLREAEGDQHSGTTPAATMRAQSKIREVLGEDKTREFTAFISERWSGGAAQTANAKPNSVPTDTRIVVNAPAYRMDVFENGQLVKTYKVGIGYPEFPLPQGMRQAQSIIFNPTWTPPDEPWVEASNKVKVGQTVSAGSKLNPLGPVKIPIGLPSLIHGGKSPAKLGSFASHGCVGLTDKQVQDFSLVLARLGGGQVTPEEIAEFEKERKTNKDLKPTNVKLNNAVPVELRYETIVVEDGRLHIYRDVYDKGTNTEENLRAVLEAHGTSLEQLNEQERAQVQQALQEMARDAQGNPTGPDAAPSPSPSPAKNGNKADKTTGERVTRTIKGRKEIVIDIAALRGKGYPAPVNLDTGGAPQKQNLATRSNQTATPPKTHGAGH